MYPFALLFLVLAVFTYGIYHLNSQTQAEIAASAVVPVVAPSRPAASTVLPERSVSSSSSSFQCDGRSHCSEMTSCAEARFFLNNCSDTKMDGDGDGIPCEDQWCGH